MKVSVTYGGDPIPKSPFTVGVAAPLDLSKVKVNGLENSKYLWAGSLWRVSGVWVIANMSCWKRSRQNNFLLNLLQLGIN